MVEIKQKHKVSENKIKEIKELVKLIDSYNTVFIASIKGLPTKQFQKIKKNLGDKVIIKNVKKRALIRAIDNSKKEKVKPLKSYIIENNSVLFSSLDPFDLSSILAENKSPVKAKAGQISNIDIEVEAGPTDLPAGPAVSELGALGLQVMVKEGKIEIRESKVIVKKGNIITESAASVMGKLNIMPFSVGFIPLAAYDDKSGLIFTELIIDREGTISKIKDSFARANAFAVFIAYPAKEIIGFLLAKALSHKSVLEKLLFDTPKTENVEEVKE
ncbi:MAG: 50S ribosomal protein L10 [Candidatus Pacearchaeota archaeon]